MGQSDDLVIFLVCKHSHNVKDSLSFKIVFQRLGQTSGAVLIMGAVRDEPGPLSYDREPAGPAGLRHAPAQHPFTDPKAHAPQRLQNFQRKHGMCDLVLACQRDLHPLHSAIIKPLPFQPVAQVSCLGFFRHHQRTAKLYSLRPDDLHNLPALPHGHYGTSFLDDSGLLRCNFFQCGSQKLHMIHADGGDHCRQRILHDIGGIHQSAHSRLKHHHIALLFLKIQKTQRSLKLKRRGMGQPHGYHAIAHLFYPLHKPAKGRLRNQAAVDLNPFPIVKYGRGNIPAHLVAAAFQSRCHIGRHRSLPVGSRYMHELQRLLGIPQPAAQLPDAVQTGNHPQPPHLLHIFHNFLIVH